MKSCAISEDGKTIVAGDASGRVHLLRFVGSEHLGKRIGLENVRSQEPNYVETLATRSILTAISA